MRLLQLPGNNLTVSPWQTVFNGPAGSMSGYHSKNLATRASWFYVGSFNHRADFLLDRAGLSRQIVEETTEFRQKVFIAFVDFRAAFHSVDRKALWRILELTGLPEKYCRLLKALHHWTES
ncbi:hypothetical protein QYM36_002990, partial [Artemia franciscana]